MSRKMAATLARDVDTFVALVRLTADHNTRACQAFTAKGGAEFFAKHTSEANVRNVEGAVKGKTFTASGKLPWVHSMYSPLTIPVRHDGDIVRVSRPSLAKAWEVLQRDGEVSADLRAVSDAAYDAGKVKRTWAGRFLMYAATADLPELDDAKTAKRAVTSSAL